jgi:glycosyltransferase involved in cell wall biosynthesis
MTDALENELVSVIIPCHNHARFLVDAIDNVTRQTYRTSKSSSSTTDECMPWPLR